MRAATAGSVAASGFEEKTAGSGGVQALTGRSVAARSQSGELRAPSPALGQTNGQAAEALTRDDGG